MKYPNKIIIILLILFVLTCFNGYAQQNSEENTYIINQYFQLNNEASLFENKIALNSTSVQLQKNLVILNQAGNSNVIDIKQNGTDSQNINQLGNNNYYNFISYYNSLPSNFNIIQQGNDNNLQIYGENSLIKNISIVQNGNFETLIIKNY